MATSPSTNWNEFLVLKEVLFKSPPFGLASAPKSTEDALVQMQKEYRDFVTPDDYNQFALQIGPGTLGRVRIYACVTNLQYYCCFVLEHVFRRISTLSKDSNRYMA